MSALSPLAVGLGLLLVALCGFAVGVLVARRGVTQQIAAVRDQAQREREEERVRQQTAHEAIAATIRQVGAAQEEGSAQLIAGLREQLSSIDAERGKAIEARETANAELAAVNARLVGAQAQMNELRDQFQTERTAIEERIRELVQGATAKALNDANAALLEQNAKQFNEQRAETMKSVEVATKPLTDGIVRLQQTVVEFDKERAVGAESLKASLEAMARSDDTLRQTVERSTTETAKLATALRDNRVRGRWGEIGLRNVLEKAGLTGYCDYVEQTGNEDGKRPDVVISLPGDREISVDAKVPLEAYMQALEATDPAEQQRLFVENANALRAKVRDLSSKGYHRTAKSIGATIMYVQIESVLSAALSTYPSLIEEALDLGIVISGPATLLAYLSAFSREWSLHKQSLNASQIVEQAHEMLNRLVIFAERFAVVGTKLNDSVKAWNASVGSFDGRLVVTAMQIAELSGTAFAVSKPPAIIETTPRELCKTDELEAAALAIAGQRLTALPA